jgi:hypothetical protein
MQRLYRFLFVTAMLAISSVFALDYYCDLTCPAAPDEQSGRVLQVIINFISSLLSCVGNTKDSTLIASLQCPTFLELPYVAELPRSKNSERCRSMRYRIVTSRKQKISTLNPKPSALSPMSLRTYFPVLTNWMQSPWFLKL